MSDFALSSGNVEAVAELSRRLDGLPLAVELAAARTRLLEPAALLARVEHGLALLRWDTADLPPRHRTLRATLDWSYALLSPEEQARLPPAGGLRRRLHPGGGRRRGGDGRAGRGAAGRRAGAGGQAPGARPRSVAGESPASGSWRPCASTRWSGWRRAAKRRRRAIATWPTTWRWPSRRSSAMLGPDEERWLHRLDHEVDNLRLAQEWAITRGDAEAEWRLVAALALFWVFRGYLREGAERIAAALSRSYEAAPALRARFLEGAGTARPLVRRRRARGRPLRGEPGRRAGGGGDRAGGARARPVGSRWRTPGATSPAPARSSPRCWPWPARPIPG